MPMGGGSSGGGGAVVQYTDPFAASNAGLIGAQAASEANRLASSQINTAINQMNQQYQAAMQNYRPYTQTGIQALNKLNQYIGLDPYNPGNAPVAPKTLDLNDYLGKVTRGQINNYVMENSVGNRTGDPNAGNIALNYMGAGAYDNSRDPGFGTTGEIATGKLGSGYFGSAGAIGRNLENPIRAEIARLALEQDRPGYELAKQAYDQNLIYYNQAKDWQQQYLAEGPLTQAQITDRVTNQPGYQAELGQGIEAINRAGAAKGSLGSGGILKDLMNYGQNTLSKYYGNTLSLLAQQAGQGQQAAGGIAALQSNLGNNTANLYGNLADINANSALASGNALSQAMIAANQQYKTVGGGGGGGGMEGIGSVLGGIGSIASAFSSKTLKTKISTPLTSEILDKVNKLDLDKWKYKGIDREHIGPYAEQFSELFGTGDGTSINLIDAVGVLIGAVKELDKKLTKLTNPIKGV